MPFEHRSQPILPTSKFVLRQFTYIGYALALVLTFLVVGMLGYHYFLSLPWLDSILNASMILSGMGPVDPITTQSGKIFASLYAVLSGVVFAVATGIIIAPILHRVMHSLHFKRK